MSSWKSWLGAGAVVVLLAAFILFFVLTRDTQVAPSRLIGAVWTASVGGDGGVPHVYYVTREDRAVTRAFDVRGRYTYEHSYSIYMLHARAAADGASLAAVQIARIETTSPDFEKYRAYRTLPDGPGILGPQGDVIWLWNNGPEARDLRTLAPVCTLDTLRARNPDLAPLLPDDPKYTRVLAALDAIVLKTKDARYVRADPATGELLPVDDGALAAISPAYTKTADSAFEYLPPSGKSLWSVSVAGLVLNSHLQDDWWYALLSASERAGLGERVGSMEEWHLRTVSTVPETAASLYRGRYTLEPKSILGRTDIKLDASSVAGVGEERFLMAGFLRRPGTFDPWTVPPTLDAQPSTPPAAPSFIVLHRAAIGEKAPWLLTRLGADAVKHWTRDTGFTELNHVCDGGGFIVISGYTPDHRPRGHWPERLIFLDATTGSMRTLNTASSELAPGG